MTIYSPTISGSLTISGSILTTGNGLPLTGSIISSGSFTSIGNTVVSGSFTVITGSTVEFQVLGTGVKVGNFSTDNHTVTGSLLVSGSITTLGNITAQTLVVQTVTSSVSFITGSTKFGSLSTNTHQFTGSMFVTGALSGTSATFSGTFRVENPLDVDAYIVSTGGDYNTNLYLGYGDSETETYIKRQGSNLYFGTSNVDRLIIGFDGAATFSRNDSGNISLTLSNAFINQGNLLNFIHNSGGTTTNAFIGHGGDSSGNLVLINNGITALSFARSSGAATFSSSVTAGDLISTSYGSARIQVTSTTNSANSGLRYGAKDSAGTAKNAGIYYVAGTTTATTFLSLAANDNDYQFNVLANGNVGIGTSSPTNTLHVSKAAYMGQTWTNSAAGGISAYLNVYDTTYGVSFGTDQSAYLQFITNAAERMRITSGGNVGIGTSSPGQKLSVAGKISFAAYETDQDEFGFWTTTGSSGGVTMATAGATNLLFRTNNTERMRITSGGYLKASNNGSYYGSTGDYHELISNKIATAAVVMQNSSSDPYGLFINLNVDPNNATNYILRGYSTGGGLSLYTIFSNGTTAGRSDIRLKKNIVDATPKLDNLMKLRVVNYEWKQSINGSKEIGLIAQEVEEIFPNLVITEPIIKEREIVKEDGSTEIEKYEDGDSKSLKNSVLPYITIKAVQELYDLVKEQQAQIEAQQAEINELKNK